MSPRQTAVLVLLVALTTGGGLRAEPPPCEGRTLATIRIEGCEGVVCAREEDRARLVRLTGLVAGEPWSVEHQALAVERLLESGYFHTIEPICEVRHDEAHLRLRVADNWIVREVAIEGNQFFYDSDVRKRVFLRAGSVLDPREAPLRSELARQAASIERLYVGAGFAQARVHVEVQAREGNRVQLRVLIEEGDKDRVGGVDVLFARKRGFGEREACPAIDVAEVRAATGLGRGDVFTEPEGKRARQRVLQMLRRRGYVRPLVSLAPPDARRRVLVTVQLGACYDVRFFVREDRQETSYRESEDGDFAAVMPFADSGAFDEQEAEIGRQEIESLLESRGRLFAEVRLHYRDFALDAQREEHPADVAGAIHYYVTADSVTEIRGIFLHGAKAFPAATIRGWMETEIYDFFGAGGFVQIQRLLNDLTSVRERYRDAGYLGFRFLANPASASRAGSPGGPEDPSRTVRTLRRRGDWIIADYAYEDLFFTVVRPEGEGTVYVHIWLEEGPVSKIAALALEGQAALSETELRALLALGPGDAFSPSRVEQAIARLRRHYHSRGYYPARITARCTNPAAPGESCRLDTVRAPEISLQLRIEEGHRRVVGERFVRGDFRTRRSVVLDALPAPGEPYDQERIQRGVRRLRDLGIFETIRVRPVGLADEPPAESIGLVVDLEESRAMFLDLAVGFETLNRDEQSMPDFLARTLSGAIAASDQRDTGYGAPALLRIPDLLFVMEASFLHRNFLGLGKELHVPLKYGLSTTQWNRLASFRPTYIDKRPFGWDLRFRLTPFLVYDRATQTLDQFQYGVEMEFSRQFAKGLFGSLGYELSHIQVRDPRAVDAEFGPFTLQNKLSPRLSWDGTDNPLNPSRGLALSASLSYINALREASFDNFLRYELAARAYVSLRRTLTLAVFLRFGGSYSFESADLPQTERFRLGGNQGMRGFADDGVGQYERDGSLRVTRALGEDGRDYPVPLPIGGDTVVSGTIELRFPILRQLDLWGAGFLDWGALAEDPGDLHPASFRLSSGFGLRWLVGGQVPLRVDYGIVIDPRCKRYTSDWQCVKEDFGALHFGMLYSF